jgi:hypothetical protein
VYFGCNDEYTFAKYGRVNVQLVGIVYHMCNDYAIVAITKDEILIWSNVATIQTKLQEIGLSM